MTPKQCQEARRLLGWSQDRLGAISGTGAHAVSTFELKGRVTAAAFGGIDRLTALRAALEAAGVVFTNGEEPGVKVRKADP